MRSGVGARVVTGVVALGALVYIAAVDPHEPGHYPGCPIRALTGWYCPGCGGLRSAHDLLHGDLAGAAHDNAAVWLALAAVGWAVLGWRRGRWSEGRVALVAVTVFVAMLGFAVLRNLPGFEALRPL